MISLNGLPKLKKARHFSKKNKNRNIWVQGAHGRVNYVANGKMVIAQVFSLIGCLVQNFADFKRYLTLNLVLMTPDSMVGQYL